MTRTAAREIAVRLGFGIAQSGEDAKSALDIFFEEEYFASLAVEDELFSRYPDEKQLEYIRAVVTGTLENKTALDDLIEKYSKGWKLPRISRIAAAILRTALFEVLYLDDVPDSVAINEAVELAKVYEESETVAFINGILGSFMRSERGYAPEATEADEAPETRETQEPEEPEATEEQQ